MSRKRMLVQALLAALLASPAAVLAQAGPVARDGSGSGSGSWIGYMLGGNAASGTNSAVTAGASNLAAGQGAFVGAGTSNQALGVSSLVIGGFDNRALAIDSLVGAGAGNRAAGVRSVVIGGGYNLASGDFSFIGGGGRDGTASSPAGSSTLDHVAAGKWSTIAGGKGNRAGTASSHVGATVGGGEQNQAINVDATVAGGTLNVASGTYATVAGGQSNVASGSGASVGGGISNTASGAGAAIPGGTLNVASGNYSFAAGRRARSTFDGAITLADGSNFDFSSTAPNQFSVRATGGVRLVTAVDGSGAATAGVTLAAGSGTWASLSDRAAKADLVPVDAQWVLARLRTLPLYTWRYRSEVSGALHMGPTAQDFHAAFGLGDSDTRIATVDADGVALAAIQGLAAQVRERDEVLATQARELAGLESRIGDLERGAADIARLRAAVEAALRAAPPAARRVKLPAL
jgi:hypothetical protein